MSLRWAAPLLAAAALHPAVAGAPEPGPGGTLAQAELTSSNDMFGNGLGNGDDFRTAAISGMLRLDRVVLAADAAMLTDRDGRTRSDEALVIAGMTLGTLVPTLGWHAGGFVGAGLHLHGNLGGQETQNVVHRIIQAEEVFLPYDGNRRIRPAFAGSLVAGRLAAMPEIGGWWGAQVVASGRYAVGGELIVEGGPRLVLVGQEAAFWAGARWRDRGGEAPGATAEATGQHEDGPWLDSGTWITPIPWLGRWWGWQVRGAINPSSRAALGSIGLVVSPGGSPGGTELALEHDLAVYNGGGLGTQLRWYPCPYQLRHRSALVLDYRFGTEPDGRLRLDGAGTNRPLGADLRHDQWTLGWEEGLRSPPWSGWHVAPWVQAGTGLRLEGVVIEGDGARIAAGRAVAPVLRGAAGVRLEWREYLGVGVSVDGWLPAWHEDLDVDGRRVRLNDPGLALGAHVAAHVTW